MVDLTGGLPAERESIPTSAPDDPDMRLGVNIWLQDDQGRFALPRIGVEALSSSWDKPAVQANIALADGRVLIGSCEGSLIGPYDDAGRASVIGAGPIRFECVKPFERWTMSFRGPALDTTIGDQLAGAVGHAPWVDVEIDVDMTMAVPPWVQGEMSEDARRRMSAGLVHGRRALRAALPRDRDRAHRRRGRHAVHGHRAAYQPLRRARHDGVPRALLADGGLPRRPCVRLHRVP
jgi:hypothetical protein